MKALFNYRTRENARVPDPFGSHNAISKRSKYTVTVTDTNSLTYTVISPSFTRQKYLERNQSYDKKSMTTSWLLKPRNGIRIIYSKDLRPGSAEGPLFGPNVKKMSKYDYFIKKETIRNGRKFKVNVFNTCITQNKAMNDLLTLFFNKFIKPEERIAIKGSQNTRQKLAFGLSIAGVRRNSITGLDAMAIKDAHTKSRRSSQPEGI